ncbi:MAG: HAMP domain-containing histidine kinase [Saprospiraceae bacterium]|nr:HAMP domain-containing histidine kinase [Saprospiraceae bacterium]
MTHEFKTPLTSIQISAKVLETNRAVHSDERLRKYASIISDQAARLTQQIERVLQIASMQNSDLKLNFDQLDLHEVITHIANQLHVRIVEENVYLNLQLSAKATAIVADRLHLSNVIHGLIDNAIKYSRDSPEVRITTTQMGDDICFFVEDSGIGISSDDLKRVGQQFYRVPNGDRHDAKGFGLGLHYIKHVVEQHGWTFAISSQLGEGTQVKIIIKTK